MAPDKKEKKRKAAPAAAELPAKKTKKADAKPAQTKDAAPKPILKKKDNGTAPKIDASVKANGEPARQIQPRKRAADFLGDEGNDEPAAPAPAPEKQAAKKKPKKEDTSKKAKKAEKAVEESDEEIVGDVISEPGSGEEDLDDQTAELIKGFESSGDEDASEDEGFNPDQPVPRIPDSKKAKRKILKKQKKGDAPSEPGTVYIGRIPHGFYEHQMRAYFSQFGDITRLRLSRNRLTGRSKHYAFVEFSSTTVAKIVAETMDNYLMYGHILKCKYVPAEQLHPEVWKGANRRFKKTPWNRIEKKRLEKGKTREQWSQRIVQEQKRRQAKVDKLKALGYEMDLPALKSVDDVPVQEPKAVEQAPEEETVKAIEAPSAESNDTPKKKAAKGKKADQGTPKQDAPSESPSTKAKGKANKGSKTKAKA